MEEINQPRGSWFTKNRRVVYENRYGLRVVHDEVLRPNKSEGIYDYLKVKSGAYTLPLDSNGNVYLVEQFRYPANILSIEVASGAIESGETSLDAGKRELKEELGIVANQWINLSRRDDPAPHIMGSTQQLFLAMDLTFEEKEYDETEKQNLRTVKMNLEEAVQAVRESRISETPSKLAIMLAKDYLENPDLYLVC